MSDVDCHSFPFFLVDLHILLVSLTIKAERQGSGYCLGPDSETQNCQKQGAGRPHPNSTGVSV